MPLFLRAGCYSNKKVSLLTAEGWRKEYSWEANIQPCCLHLGCLPVFIAAINYNSALWTLVMGTDIEIHWLEFWLSVTFPHIQFPRSEIYCLITIKIVNISGRRNTVNQYQSPCTGNAVVKESLMSYFLPYNLSQLKPAER